MRLFLSASAASEVSPSTKNPPKSATEVGVENHAGSLSAQVPFKLPEYHGITPQVGLSYDSGSGDGFVGVGWRLFGPQEIRRASPGLSGDADLEAIFMKAIEGDTR